MSWSFRGLIRSELYCLGIKIQKKNFFIAFIDRELTIYSLVTFIVVLTNTKWLLPGKRNPRMYNTFISQEKDKEQ